MRFRAHKGNIFESHFAVFINAIISGGSGTSKKNVDNLFLDLDNTVTVCNLPKVLETDTSKMFEGSLQKGDEHVPAHQFHKDLLEVSQTLASTYTIRVAKVPTEGDYRISHVKEPIIEILKRVAGNESLVLTGNKNESVKFSVTPPGNIGSMKWVSIWETGDGIFFMEIPGEWDNVPSNGVDMILEMHEGARQVELIRQMDARWSKSSQSLGAHPFAFALLGGAERRNSLLRFLQTMQKDGVNLHLITASHSNLAEHLLQVVGFLEFFKTISGKAELGNESIWPTSSYGPIAPKVCHFRQKKLEQIKDVFEKFPSFSSGSSDLLLYGVLFVDDSLTNVDGAAKEINVVHVEDPDKGLDTQVLMNIIGLLNTYDKIDEEVAAKYSMYSRGRVLPE